MSYRHPTRIALLLGALSVGACRGHDPSDAARAATKPIDVASMIAGCKDLDECTRQCEVQQPNACVSAGRLYEFGHGVAADPSRAFQLYAQACDWKFAGGCYNAAVLLEAGKGVAKDLERARELYGKVCAMGSQTACERAKTLGAPASHQEKGE